MTYQSPWASQDMGVPQSTTEVEEAVVEKTLMTYSIIETKYGPKKQISLGKMRVINYTSRYIVEWYIL